MSPRYNLYPHGIINPNYPGFQHLAHTLSSDYSDPNTFSYSDIEDDYFDRNNNENECDEPEKLIETKLDGTNPKSLHVDPRKQKNSKNDCKLFDECDEDVILTKLSLSSTPPDILYEHTIFQDEHQPDLIKNLKTETADVSNDDKPLVTNIVGDFGKEVEEEFGVIGYNFGIFRSFDSPTIYQKTVDADLSSALDKTLDTKTKLVSHDERPVLTFNTHQIETTDSSKITVKQVNRSSKTSSETAKHQRYNAVNNNSGSCGSSNHKIKFKKSVAEQG